MSSKQEDSLPLRHKYEQLKSQLFAQVESTMSDNVPLKPLSTKDTPPSYAEDASSTATAEAQPFISLSERDIEAASPPAYVENSDEEAKPHSLEGTPFLVKLCVWTFSTFLFLLGFGALLTLGILFVKILVFVWSKIGLL